MTFSGHGWLNQSFIKYVCTLLIVGLKIQSAAYALGRARPQPIVEDTFSQHAPPAHLGSITNGVVHGSFELSILTYNVHGLPLPIGIDHSRYADIGRILRQRRLAGNAPQLVMIQEAFHSRTEELVTQAGYPYVARGAPSKGVRASAGLLLLSQLPLNQISNVVYDFCTSWDCWSRKGVLHARIDMPGMPRGLDLYSTHMNSNPDADFWTPTEEAQQARMTQMQEMREYVWATKGSGAALIMGGDYNFRKGDDDYESFLGFFMVQETSEVCGHNQGCLGNELARNFGPNAIDHQFYDPGSNVIRIEPTSYGHVFQQPVNGRMLSDHEGIEMRYRISW